MTAVNEVTTPRMNGCRWPAEWEPHAATWMAWPHRLKTWPGRFEPIPQRFAQLIGTLAQFERVNVLAGGEAVMAQAQSLVGQLDNVVLHDIPTNDAWARDFGPLFHQKPGDGAANHAGAAGDQDPGVAEIRQVVHEAPFFVETRAGATG